MALGGTAGATLKESPERPCSQGAVLLRWTAVDSQNPPWKYVRISYWEEGAFQARLVPIQRYCIASITA